MKTFWQDIRYGARMLKKSPGFTAIALMTLALGIGANTAIFTLVNALLLRPLPGVNRPQQLVLVADSKHGSFSYPHYEQFREGSQSFSDLLVVTDTGKRRMTVSGTRAPEAEGVSAQAVSGNFFSLLGVPPAVGRTLTADDDLPNRPQAVAVLSHGFWRRRFGLDPSVIGRTITLDDIPFSIVGVAKQGFGGVEVGRSPDLWWPIQMLPQVDRQPGSVTDARSRQTANKLLVVSQIALSCLLLIGAGLFVRTLQKLRAWDPGFQREHLLMFGIDHPLIKNFDERWMNLHKEILRRLAGLPGVRSASLAGVQSLTGNIGHRYRPKLAGAGDLPGREDSRVYGIGVGPNYLKTMGIPLLKGRELGPEDEPAREGGRTGPLSVRVMLSDLLARRLFGAEDPIGKQLPDAENPKLTLEVVGVVGDAHHQKLKAEQLPMFYHLDYIWPTFYVRTLGNPQAMAGAIRQNVRALDSQMEVTGLRTMDEVIDEQLLQERTISQLAGFFSLSALVLACLGLYGTLSYNVARRTREIGLRIALGAKECDVLAAIIRQGMTLTLLGCTLGVVLAVAVTRVVASLLYGVTPTDPLTFVLTVLLLGAVALTACYLPARRAARVDPMAALRCE